MITLELLTLETKRLILRVIAESSAGLVLNYYSDNKEFLAPWEPIRADGFYTIAYQEQQMRMDLEAYSEGRLFKVWLVKKGSNCGGPLIGSVALNNIIRGCFQSCHLGYKLHRAEVNKGYMTEAVAAIVEYAFAELQLHRLEANIMPRNAASLKVVEKLGFYNEGLARQYLKINGQWEDHLHMVRLNSNMP